METNEGRADAMDIMSEAKEAAACLLPLDMVNALADLVDPAAVAKEMPWLAGEIARHPASVGRRSRSTSGTSASPMRRGGPSLISAPLGQSYRLFEMWMERMYQSVEGSWQNKARARFAADVITAAVAPTNYLGTNPEALRKAVETGGLSLVRGVQNMLNDMARGGMPSMVDRKQFTVGKDIGCHPGGGGVPGRDVRGAAVHARHAQGPQHSGADDPAGDQPVLRPRSRAGAVAGRVHRQPGHPGVHDRLAEPGLPARPRQVGTERLPGRGGASQRGGQTRSRAPRRSTCSGCAPAASRSPYVLAHLAAVGDDSAGAATFVVTMLTGEKPNVVGMLDTGQARTALEQAAAKEEIVPGSALRSLFAMLRPNDLVFNYLVSGWLKGESPAPFDVLAWNDDATRTTAKFAMESSRLSMDGWDRSGLTACSA